MLPEVLNRIQIRRVRRKLNRVHTLIVEPRLCNIGSMRRSIVLEEPQQLTRRFGEEKISGGEKIVIEDITLMTRRMCWMRIKVAKDREPHSPSPKATEHLGLLRYVWSWLFSHSQ